jgi:hypothetical protein
MAQAFACADFPLKVVFAVRVLQALEDVFAGV